ncbi:conserved hypothetical protein [Ricinus communis]|uniref:Uncharacterized protein n=1 Tax=Ricinus communis TaxID=3988 RepID=B9SYK4_RICCO|nr:conserved hypothetical protein [Ricinus communis]
MIIFLVKLICFAINTASNLVSRLIFRVTAYLLVLIIQGLRLPGEAAHGALQQIAEAIKTCFEYIMELVMEMISSIISSSFDLLIEAVTGSASFTGSAIGGLVEKARTSFDGLLTDLPELAEEFSGMVSTAVTDLWDNYKDALRYITENA